MNDKLIATAILINVIAGVKADEGYTIRNNKCSKWY